MTNKTKPQILAREIVAKTRIFSVEQLSIQFSNQKQGLFERMIGNEAVMVLPITANNTVLLVREYAAGIEAYEIGLLKGRIDDGEQASQAALREMQEEVGFAAKRLEFIRTFVNAPHYSGAKMHLYFAYDLYAAPLPGDELEPLEVLEFDVNEVVELMSNESVNDARTLFSLQLFLNAQQAS